MTEPATLLDIPPKILQPYLDRLADLFGRMEAAYTAVADAYGFACNGCRDNCCLTRFYHHTLLEYFYLYSGWSSLEEKTQRRLRQKADAVNRFVAAADARGEKAREMCPLNENGRCLLYAFRPMICRLHGIPNEMRPPGGRAVHGPGCGDFDRQCGQRDYIVFDRTPFYLEMAQSEKAIRETVGYREKIRLTVAEIITGFPRKRADGVENI